MRKTHEWEEREMENEGRREGNRKKEKRDGHFFFFFFAVSVARLQIHAREDSLSICS